MTLEEAAVEYAKWRCKNKEWPPFDQMQAIPYQGVVIIVRVDYPTLIASKGKIDYAR